MKLFRKMMCKVGRHDWDRPTYTRTKVIYKCKGCGKVKVRFVPLEVLVVAGMVDIAVNGSVVAFLWATGHQDMAKNYVKGWSESRQKELEKERLYGSDGQTGFS